MRISNRQLEIPSLILLVNIETNFNEVKFPTPWPHVWQTWPTHSLTISNGFSCCLFPPYFKPIQSYQRLSVSVEKLVYFYTEYQLHLFLSLINRQEKSTTEILERTEGFPTVIDLWGFSDWPVCEFFFFSKVMPWCTQFDQDKILLHGDTSQKGSNIPSYFPLATRLLHHSEVLSQDFESKGSDTKTWDSQKARIHGGYDIADGKMCTLPRDEVWVAAF